MNVHSRPAMKRVITWTAASTLAVGGLMAGAGSATADDIVDITGVVTNAAGAPLADADVIAYVQNGREILQVDSVSTDATGRYNFDNLDAATRALIFDDPTDADQAAIRAATSFKLYFSKNVPNAELRTNPGYLEVGFGGTRTITNSTAVPVNNTSASTANQALPNAAGVVVRVVGADGAPVNDEGFAQVYGAGSDNPIDAAGTFGFLGYDDPSYDNPATPDDESANAPDDGLIYIAGVDPGTYVINAGGSVLNSVTGDFRSYLSRFIGGNGTYDKAAEITLTAGAFASTGVQLTDSLTAIESPRIKGNSSVGSKLKADPGTWLRQQGTEFTYTWTKKGTPIATGATYRIRKADKKDKIGLIVNAVTLGDEFFGSVAAKSTSKVGEKSKVKVAKISGGDELRATVTVAKKAKRGKLGTPTGKVVAFDETGKKASNTAKLRGGSAVLRLRDSAEGKITVQYLGSGKLGSDTINVKSGGKKSKGGKKGKKN